MPLPLLAAAVFAMQDSFPNTPANRWAKAGVMMAIREDLLPLYNEGLYRTKTLEAHSRFEYSIYAHVALSKQLDQTERAIAGGSDLERASMLRAQALIPFYRHAAREFATEDRQLEFAPESAIERLEGLGMQLRLKSQSRDVLFSDVPADHWAAKAVGDLRALGLLNGYPDDRFRG